MNYCKIIHHLGKADTHDLIPQDIWFNDYLEDLQQNYFLTYESLPIEYQIYQRLDKHHA